MVDCGTSVTELAELYRARYRRFLRVALAVVGDADRAADVVQDAFAQALRSRQAYRGSGSVEAWVWQIVLNTARTQYARSREHVDVDVDDVDLPAEASRDSWPELRAVIAELPERQRHALFLRHYADLPYSEIGDVLGMATGTVSATLYAAHARLRQALEVPR